MAAPGPIHVGVVLDISDADRAVIAALTTFADSSPEKSRFIKQMLGIAVEPLTGSE